jgi:hypothetical protein
MNCPESIGENEKFDEYCRATSVVSRGGPVSAGETEKVKKAGFVFPNPAFPVTSWR